MHKSTLVGHAILIQLSHPWQEIIIADQHVAPTFKINIGIEFWLAAPLDKNNHTSRSLTGDTNLFF